MPSWSDQTPVLGLVLDLVKTSNVIEFNLRSQVKMRKLQEGKEAEDAFLQLKVSARTWAGQVDGPTNS